MKSRIKKIIINASALLFVFSGVAFAQDSDKRHHKYQGKANGHYKAEKLYSGRSNKHVKPGKLYREHHRKPSRAGYYCKDGFYHYYDRNDRRWRIDHFKPRQHSRDRFGYKKGHRDHDNYYRGQAQREYVVYKVALKDPKIVFKVIKKDH